MVKVDKKRFKRSARDLGVKPSDIRFMMRWLRYKDFNVERISIRANNYMCNVLGPLPRIWFLEGNHFSANIHWEKFKNKQDKTTE